MGTKKEHMELIALGTEEAPRFYTNNTQARANLFDFQLTFSQIKIIEGNTITAGVEAIVNMSPQHAKAVLALLSEHVQSYEEKFGQIQESAEPIGREPKK